jgi:hypothetical protein
MKKSATVFVILLGLFSFAGSKFKAYVGYDKSVDFSTIKTFAYYETRETSFADNSPIHEMIKYLIIIKFKASGLKQVKENPDIYVTYHTNQQADLRLDVTMYSYSYSAGWWWSPLWGSGMDVAAYTKGTLVVDAWNPKTKNIVWRGVVVGVVPEDPSPQKAQKTIEKALDSIGREWQKQLKKAE